MLEWHFADKKVRAFFDSSGFHGAKHCQGDIGEAS
jgi:hypothetical protein